MKRSKFSLSHYRLFSAKMGALYPCGLTEVLPGDTIQQATSCLMRLSPLVAPVMHPCHVRFHHWFVPHRLVWDNWEKFITGGPDGLNASVFPTINIGPTTGAPVGSIYDYYGIPPNTTGAAISISALPLRGYYLIWNEWYRDQDLQTALTFSTADGAVSDGQFALQSVAWEKDYFTTARPFQQKGPTVTIPLVGNAPVTGLALATGEAFSNTATSYFGTSASGDIGTGVPAHVTGGLVVMKGQATGAVGSGNRPQIFADLSQVTSADIDTLRKAFAIQRYQEARARYGSRYTEYLRYLGVRSSDARLQRPEYLGGGKQTVQFSEVLQTGVTTSGSTTGVGNLKGHGIAAARSNRYRRFFEEHGYIHSFVSVKPRTIYAQGIARTWNRRVKEDFWQKELEHIGQQEILNKEIYNIHATPDGIWGYNDRYDEYRRHESSVAGSFRTTLDYWHMAREFASAPVLNASFVQSNPTTRIFADTTSDTLYLMVSHSIQARRMLSQLANSFIA